MYKMLREHSGGAVDFALREFGEIFSQGTGFGYGLERWWEFGTGGRVEQDSGRET